MVFQISQCCEAVPNEEKTNQIDDLDFGHCSNCGEFTFFDEFQGLKGTQGEFNFNELDDMEDEIEEKVPTVTPKPITTVHSSDTLKRIGEQCLLPEEVYNTFDPSTISWVSERIGITARDGVKYALNDGHFVINTAEEIYNDAQVKLPIEIGTGSVLRTLNEISEVMDRILTTTNQKIVVHCAMGMERSVLSVVWYMATKWHMQLKQALKLVQSKRPIALNRLDWIAL